MAIIVADIIYQANAKGFDKVKTKLGDVEKQATKTGTASKQASVAIKSLIPLAVIAAAVKLTGVLADLGRESAGVGDEIVKTASKLGLSTKALQQYRFAAEEANVKQGTLDMAFQRFNRRTGEARQGTGVLIKGLETLNISLKDQNGHFKSNEVLFNEYTTKMHQMEDATDKTLVAFQGFDSGGVALVNLELEKSKKHFNDLGIEIDSSILMKLSEVNNTIGVMALEQSNLSTEIGSAFADVTIIIDEWQTGILQTIRDVLKLLGLIGPSLKELKIEQLNAFSDLAEAEARYENARDNRARNVASIQAKNAKARLDAITAEINKLTEFENKSKTKTIDDTTKNDPSKPDRPPSLPSKPAAKVIDDFQRILDQKTAALQGFYAGTREMQIANIQNERQRLLEQNTLDKLNIDRQRDAIINSNALTEDESVRLHQEAADKKAEIDKAYESKVFAINEKKTEDSKQWYDTQISNEELMASVGENAATSMAGAFADFATGSEQSFSEFAASFLKQISKMIIQALILRAIKSAIGGIGAFADGATFGEAAGNASKAGGGSPFNGSGAFKSFKNANGNAFSTSKFANGGDFTNQIVKQPTKFAFGGGLGLMGEAGPEAIMPLSRGSDGKLGVSMSGNGNNTPSITNVYNTTIQVKGGDNAKDDGEKIAEAFIKGIARQQIATELRPNGLISSLNKGRL